ncbi:MAG TPA: hypothetical protein VM681_02405 [Candidatus Thermoplasmatota archaeon]|nr:hypothetical protein [Candidatus Thermoplasmatota archaeon]
MATVFGRGNDGAQTGMPFTLAMLLLVLPWIVIPVNALFLGGDLLLFLLMFLVFGIGVLLAGAFES